jgi:hypothetical protein
MSIADSTITRLLQHPYNQAICQYILANSPSAHSDLTWELDKIAAILPDYKSYCPNPAHCAYVIFFTNSDKIFAAVFGMKDLLFNLPTREIAKAFMDGGEKFADLPDEWVTFYPFRADRLLTTTRKKLQHWCQMAFIKASAPEDEKNL